MLASYQFRLTFAYWTTLTRNFHRIVTICSTHLFMTQDFSRVFTRARSAFVFLPIVSDIMQITIFWCTSLNGVNLKIKPVKNKRGYSYLYTLDSIRLQALSLNCIQQIPDIRAFYKRPDHFCTDIPNMESDTMFDHCRRTRPHSRNCLVPKKKLSTNSQCD